MQITVNKPVLSDDFKLGLTVAIRKELSSEITEVNDYIYISVYSGTYPVGRFIFNKEEDKCILFRKTIISPSYHPFEYAISLLIKRFKRKKIKYLLWN